VLIAGGSPTAPAAFHPFGVAFGGNVVDEVRDDKPIRRLKDDRVMAKMHDCFTTSQTFRA